VGSRPLLTLPTRVTPAVPPAGAKASGRQGSWQTPTFSSSRIQDYGHPSAPRSRAAVCHDEGPPYAGHGRGGRANKIPPRRPESHLVPKPRSPAGTTHAALATFGLSVHLERAATFPPTCSTGIDAGLSVHMKEPATLPPGGADMPGPAGIKYASMALTRCAADSAPN
jgi:hypothetical protein